MCDDEMDAWVLFIQVFRLYSVWWLLRSVYFWGFVLACSLFFSFEGVGRRGSGGGGDPSLVLSIPSKMMRKLHLLQRFPLTPPFRFPTEI